MLRRPKRSKNEGVTPKEEKEKEEEKGRRRRRRGGGGLLLSISYLRTFVIFVAVADFLFLPIVVLTVKTRISESNSRT
jgi:hypothetical protein